MKISAFTYVRNGFEFGYPFIESIKSLCAFVDEYVVVVGDSTDGTREAVAALGNKIVIVDSIWNLDDRKNGRLFAQQSNMGIERCTGDWLIHLQADEVLHEMDVPKLLASIEKYRDHPRVEGLLFPFLNFRGDYYHIHTGRTAHRFEIRAFRKNSEIRSYRDSQGFRKYANESDYQKGGRGIKLKVVKIDVPVFHYSYTRSPRLMTKKANFFFRFYNDDQQLEKIVSNHKPAYDYNETDRLDRFTGSHPATMLERISRQDWSFVYDPKKARVSLRHRFLNVIERITGYRIGEFKNYRIVKA